MKTYSLLVGSRALSGNAKFQSHQDKLLQDTTREHFPGGFTILRARGGWWNSTTKRFETEESREVRVVTSRYQAVARWARAIGAVLGQREVILTESGRARKIALGKSRS